jgi:hypothetical protein
VVDKLPTRENGDLCIASGCKYWFMHQLGINFGSIAHPIIFSFVFAYFNYTFANSISYFANKYVGRTLSVGKQMDVFGSGHCQGKRRRSSQSPRSGEVL